MFVSDNNSDNESSPKSKDVNMSSRAVSVSRSRSRSPRGMRKSNAISVDGLRTPECDAVVDVDADATFAKEADEKLKRLKEDCPDSEPL